MPDVDFNDRLNPSHSPARRPRRAAYALPTLFTAGNIFLGYVAILQAFRGAMDASAGHFGFNEHFDAAAKMIGIAVVLDGLDGRIARMTNTVSDFGREMDSLADVITFGLAPAVLAFAWGLQFIDRSFAGLDALLRAGYFICFMFLLCGSARLARFNVTTNPKPKNPGRPDRKYFVGMPIPSAAALVAAVVYASGSAPLRWWPFAVGWLCLLGLMSFLMVSTWRYPSFKDIHLVRPRTPLTIILVASLIFLIYIAPQPMLLLISAAYVATGIFIRAGGIIRRRWRHEPASARPEHQVG
ncbi:MAG TPA: CDP-diacylglycerol--serine O-phosphatidyltransferase [Bryobacteraceae bacterium]|jgi:CDP-diacylglycerol--serine O-phosphatidyltransferase|nr:CDP-diacylglycerol--serine O-phosphatidyltransferase [Bryobacteraceae bacterium]